MKLKDLKAICTKRYGKYDKINANLYINYKISELNIKLYNLEKLKKEINSK